MLAMPDKFFEPGQDWLPLIVFGTKIVEKETFHVKKNYIPFVQILPRVDVFVTNGGFGSVNLSLSQGTPMVVAGDTEDKIFTASRVGWSGAAINLVTGRPTGEQIRTAVRAVLRTKSIKRTLQDCRRSSHDPTRSI